MIRVDMDNDILYGIYRTKSGQSNSSILNNLLFDFKYIYIYLQTQPVESCFTKTIHPSDQQDWNHQQQFGIEAGHTRSTLHCENKTDTFKKPYSIPTSKKNSNNKNYTIPKTKSTDHPNN